MERDWEAIDDEPFAGGIGARFKIKRHGRVVAEADDVISARMRAKQERRLHRSEQVTVYDRVHRNDEPID